MQGWEAIARLRLSLGLEVETHLGGAFRRSTTDLEFPAVRPVCVQGCVGVCTLSACLAITLAVMAYGPACGSESWTILHNRELR